MKGNKFYQKNPSVVCTELEDGAVLLNLDTKYYYNLNKTGFKIFQELEESGDPGLVAAELVREYETDIMSAKSSVNCLIRELEKENLIVMDETPGFIDG